MKTLIAVTVMALSVPVLGLAQDARIPERDREAFLECTKQENVDTSCWRDGEVINHGRKVTTGRIREVLEDLRNAFPDGKTEILDAVFDDNAVVTRIMFRGTHTGVSKLPVMSALIVGLPPTGKRVEFQAMHLWKLRDGKIVEHYAVREELTIARQLGLAISSTPTAPSK